MCSKGQGCRCDAQDSSRGPRPRREPLHSRPDLWRVYHDKRESVKHDARNVVSCSLSHPHDSSRRYCPLQRNLTLPREPKRIYSANTGNAEKYVARRRCTLGHVLYFGVLSLYPHVSATSHCALLHLSLLRFPGGTSPPRSTCAGRALSPSRTPCATLAGRSFCVARVLSPLALCVRLAMTALTCFFP